MDEKRAIVFVNTKRQCDNVYSKLDACGYRWVGRRGREGGRFQGRQRLHSRQVLFYGDQLVCAYGRHASKLPTQQAAIADRRIRMLQDVQLLTPHDASRTSLNDSPISHPTPGAPCCTAASSRTSVRSASRAFATTRSTSSSPPMWQGAASMCQTSRWCVRGLRLRRPHCSAPPLSFCLAPPPPLTALAGLPLLAPLHAEPVAPP